MELFDFLEQYDLKFSVKKKRNSNWNATNIKRKYINGDIIMEICKENVFEVSLKNKFNDSYVIGLKKGMSALAEGESIKDSINSFIYEFGNCILFDSNHIEGRMYEFKFDKIDKLKLEKAVKELEDTLLVTEVMKS